MAFHLFSRSPFNWRLLLSGLALAAVCTACSTSSTAPETGSVDRVVVHKAARQLELWRDGEIIRRYRIALGGAPLGHKFREGDERTPEGDYLLDWRNPNSNFYKSIHISYPSPGDRLASRELGHKNPGGMIMLHGLPNYVQSQRVRQEYAGRDWTNGCIAVQNHEMDEIWNLVPDGTPIRILP
ncbi:MAG: L,D-transpeptidase family protein [Chromatiaceae bacterium]|nr:L,D-transpeptidase family protein [Chromatiaceae bacterium]